MGRLLIQSMLFSLLAIAVLVTVVPYYRGECPETPYDATKCVVMRNVNAAVPGSPSARICAKNFMITEHKGDDPRPPTIHFTCPCYLGSSHRSNLDSRMGDIGCVFLGQIEGETHTVQLLPGGTYFVEGKDLEE